MYIYEEKYMKVTFTSDAYANITMFGDNALAMLKMMGHSAKLHGTIQTGDVPLALSRLKAAMDSENTLHPTVNINTDEPEASMALRGLPLIDLLSAAAKAKGFVMWDKSMSLS
jgi:hypothetical protein